eukprot:XP_011669822.1 PREDICTED: alpha-(1,6)-fucosyltransferase-like [Strongylocentrotus purpuratus]
MDTRYKVLLMITLVFLISTVIVFEREISPRYTQHMKSSKQKLPRPDDEQKPIVSDNNTLSQVDGNSSWQEGELRNLSNLIQQRLHFLQNPPDCREAKKIVCDLSHRVGFGSIVHHLSFCLIMAYGSERTLILNSSEWVYSPGGWDKFFRPLSENCLDGQLETTAYTKWPTPDGNDSIQVVKIPVVADFAKTNTKPDFLPLAIPEDISERLRRVHSKPLIWWIGQIITYILKPQPQTLEFIDNKTNALGFTHPIVGIQVRRTDKIKGRNAKNNFKGEAKFHGIEEYMDHVEKYYQELEKRKEVSVRRVFLATDEVSLLYEARKKYPGYVFVSDNNISQSASVSLRQSEESLMGMIIDLHLLARSDFVVCTLSSNICRLVYEMLQHSHFDASKKLISVDRQYFWSGENSKAKGKTAKMPVYEGAENVHLYGV